MDRQPRHFVNAAGYRMWVTSPTCCGHRASRQGSDFTTWDGFLVEWWECRWCGNEWTTEVRL